MVAQKRAAIDDFKTIWIVVFTPRGIDKAGVQVQGKSEQCSRNQLEKDETRSTRLFKEGVCSKGRAFLKAVEIRRAGRVVVLSFSGRGRFVFLAIHCGGKRLVLAVGLSA